jgi:hypothetical protein
MLGAMNFGGVGRMTQDEKHDTPPALLEPAPRRR